LRGGGAVISNLCAVVCVRCVSLANFKCCIFKKWSFFEEYAKKGKIRGAKMAK